MRERVNMPTWQELKAELEERYMIILHGTDYKATRQRSLKQYSPFLVSIFWNFDAPVDRQTYFVTIAKSETAKPWYQSGYSFDDHDAMIRALDRYCKRRKATQMDLFRQEDI